MQVHAFDENRLISSTRAEKGKDYVCPQCLSKVRLRGGDRRQQHFFHLKKNRKCRQSQKGLIHLRLQYYIQSLFEDAQMEVIFPSIGRIADVASLSTKTVYEIQYSPMSLGEAQARCEDYESQGYTVVWILHEHTFKGRLRPVERFLRSKICYYTNMDEKGVGTIHDSGHPVNLQIRTPIQEQTWPQELQNRAISWPFYHEGDLFDLAQKGKIRKRGEPSRAPLLKRLKNLYLTLLHIALDKSSR